MAIYLGENKVDGGGNNGTSTPTIDEVAEFDANAKMNSTDMTSQEVDNFVDGLNISSGGSYIVTETFTNNATFSNTDYATGSIDVSKNGYTPVGVVGIMPASNTVLFVVTYYRISGNTLTYTLRRINGATTSTETSTFDVLYIAS